MGAEGAVGAVVAGAAAEARAMAEAGVAESIFAEADATGATAGADTSARIDRGLSSTIIAHYPNRKVRCVGQPDAPDFVFWPTGNQTAQADEVDDCVTPC